VRNFLERRLSFRQLRAIDAIDRYGNLSQAAVALGKTQPALSKSLQEAEDILRVKLFERCARGVVRCADAAPALDAARNILAVLRRLEDDLDRIRTESVATIAIGASPAAALGLLPTVLQELTHHNHRLQMRLVEDGEEGLLKRLVSGEIDLAFTPISAALEDTRFFVEPLYEELFSLVARGSHPLFNPAVEAPLYAFDFVLPSTPEGLDLDMGASIKTLQLRQSPIARSVSVGLVRELLHSTDMIAIIPNIAILGELRRGSLRVVADIECATPKLCGVARLHGAEGEAALDLIATKVRARVCELRAEHMLSRKRGLVRTTLGVNGSLPALLASPRIGNASCAQSNTAELR
jgi:LysR family pca operon transcriptional activator